MNHDLNVPSDFSRTDCDYDCIGTRESTLVEHPGAATHIVVADTYYTRHIFQNHKQTHLKRSERYMEAVRGGRKMFHGELGT